MPAVFDSLGISFQYPENWSLDRGDATQETAAVTVYSPGGAFWSVMIHPFSADPGKMAKAALQAMKQEYEEVEAEPVHEIMAGREAVGYDLNFYYLDLINTAVVRSLRANRRTYTIFCQAEDREYEQLRRIFEAMTVSLLAHFAAKGDAVEEDEAV